MAFRVMAEIPPSVQISDMGRECDRPGIYFLWSGENVVYVGQSRTLLQRVMTHVVEAKKVFDRVSYLFCEVRDLTKVERYFIEALLPKYNRCGASEFIRRVWVGHTDERPMPDRRVDRETAAKILGLTIEELVRLHSAGLEYRRIRRPRRNARQVTYSVRDLHQFAAQRPEAIIAAREKKISAFARRKP